MTSAGAGLVAGLTTLIVSPLVLSGLRRAGVLDHPTQRSSHAEAVPRGGGVAVMLGALAGLTTATGLSADGKPALVMAIIGLGILGLGEDVIGLSPARRLAAQVVLAVGPVIIAITPDGNPTGVIATTLGIVWVVACTNAFNFMDGIDGISVAQAAVTGTAWFVAGTIADEPGFATGAAVLAAGSFGFAPFNVPRARMFLGDCGSYLLGGLTAVLALLGLRRGLPVEVLVLPLGLYLADSGWTLIRRLLAGENALLPHDSHVYQQLARATSHLRTSSVVLLVVSACSALGLLSLSGQLPLRLSGALAAAVILGAYLAMPRRIAGAGTPTESR